MTKKNKHGYIDPIDGLINFFGHILMGKALRKLRKKYGSKGSKPDPYVAAGIAMGMGRLNDTEDILTLGGILGELGAFDDDDDDDVYSPKYTATRNKYSIHGNTTHNPPKSRHSSTYVTPTRLPQKVGSTTGKYIFCRVSRLDNGSCRYYLTDDSSINVGDTVLVPADQGSVKGYVISVEHYDSDNAPIPVEKATKIIGKSEPFFPRN